MALYRLVLMLHSAGVGAASADPPPKMGLLLALYNANVTTDWVKVVRADLSSLCRMSCAATVACSRP